MSLLFDHPTIEALARFLEGELGLALAEAGLPDDRSGDEVGARLDERLAALEDERPAGGMPP